jgi:hypothetical protein
VKGRNYRHKETIRALECGCGKEWRGSWKHSNMAVLAKKNETEMLIRTICAGNKIVWDMFWEGMATWGMNWRKECWGRSHGVGQGQEWLMNLWKLVWRNEKELWLRRGVQSEFQTPSGRQNIYDDDNNYIFDNNCYSVEKCYNIHV